MSAVDKFFVKNNFTRGLAKALAIGGVLGLLGWMILDAGLALVLWSIFGIALTIVAGIAGLLLLFWIIHQLMRD